MTEHSISDEESPEPEEKDDKKQKIAHESQRKDLI